jgi:hypothetical protein
MESTRIITQTSCGHLVLNSRDLICRAHPVQPPHPLPQSSKVCNASRFKYNQILHPLLRSRKVCNISQFKNNPVRPLYPLTRLSRVCNTPPPKYNQSPHLHFLPAPHRDPLDQPLLLPGRPQSAAQIRLFLRTALLHQDLHPTGRAPRLPGGRTTITLPRLAQLWMLSETKFTSMSVIWIEINRSR